MKNQHTQLRHWLMRSQIWRLPLLTRLLPREVCLARGIALQEAQIWKESEADGQLPLQFGYCRDQVAEEIARARAERGYNWHTFSIIERRMIVAWALRHVSYAKLSEEENHAKLFS